MRGVPALMHQVARTGSRELFLLLAVCLCLITGAAADAAGLGLELGAFLAGIIISETDYAHEVFSQVRPLRDVFASLFFVSVGMLLDPKFLLHNWFAVGLVVAAIVLGKSLIAFFSVYAQKWHGRTALIAGFGLAQIGEFSFVLATVGSARGLIPAEIANVILSAALITLLIAPFLFQAADPLYKRLNRIPILSAFLNRQKDAEIASTEEEDDDAQVLILGYGRVGRFVSNALKAKGIPHTVVDYDTRALAELEQAGVRVLYGDASSETVLEHMHPHKKRMAVIALPEADITEMAVRTLKRLNPNLAILTRVRRTGDIPRMQQAGANAVILCGFRGGNGDDTPEPGSPGNRPWGDPHLPGRGPTNNDITLPNVPLSPIRSTFPRPGITARTFPGSQGDFRRSL